MTGAYPPGRRAVSVEGLQRARAAILDSSRLEAARAIFSDSEHDRTPNSDHMFDHPIDKIPLSESFRHASSQTVLA
jgi:hypothetical protein